MSKFANMTHAQIVAAIAADSIVDGDEVAGLEAVIYADGEVDRGEVDLMFAINDAVSGAANVAAYNALFVRVVVDHIMADDEVDGGEVDYLRGKVFADDEVDRNEAELMFAINDALAAAGKSDNADWRKLFVDVIKAHVMADGLFDADEQAWVKARIGGDDQVDVNEQALLDALNLSL